jgi:DNA polymerase III epsilon subunit family exonuclease
VKLFLARLRNRWCRLRLRNRKLDPTARSNLKALDHLDPSRPAKTYRYVVVDVETTGVDLGRDRMVSIAAVRIFEGRILLGQIFNEMVNPGREIPRASIKLHGIYPGRVAQARTDEEVFNDFLNFLGNDILVAHHAGFDLYFLNKIMKDKYGFGLQNLALDTEKLYREIVLLPLQPPTRANIFQSGYSLDTIANFFSIEIQDRHTAMGDALATAMIFQRILARLNNGLDPMRRLVKTGYRF